MGNLKNAAPEQPGMKIGFEIPDPGEYLLEIQEGIDRYTKEDDQRVSVGIPLKVDQVVGTNGTEESIGRPVTYFITMVTKEGKLVDFGEKQIANVLACTGLLDKFAEKYDGDVDMSSEKFVGDLKLQLPNKFLKMTLSHEPDFKNKDKMRVKIETVEPAGKTTGASATAPVETGDNQAADGDTAW